VAVTAVTGVAFAGLWYGLPLVRRARGGVAPEDEL
jgi:hypothetical protein